MFSILCFGDSITYGRGEIPAKGWVWRLKDAFEDDLIHKGVYNLGIPGETSYSLRKRIRQEALPRIWRRKSDDRYVVIIQVGGNDVKEIITQGNVTTKPQDFKNYLQECVDEINELVDDIILLGLGHVDEQRTQPFEKNVFFSNRYLSEYNEYIREIAEEKGCYFLSLQEFCASNEEQKELLVDGIHPNAQGYEKLYDSIKQFLDKNNLLNQ